MRIALLLLALAACHKETVAPGAPVNTSDVDALWKLAPEGVMFGVVASPHALQLTEHAFNDVQGFLAVMPEMAPVLTQMKAELSKKLGTEQLSFAALGLSTSKGAAMFMRADKRGFVVVPIGDRDTFLKVSKSQKGSDYDTSGNDTFCKTAHDVYICASDKAMFDLIGKGHIDVSAAGARGDLEFAGNDLPVDRGGKNISLAIVAQLARGQVTFRGSVTGIPPQVLAMMGTASKPNTEGDRTTGFALVHVKPLLATLPVPSQGMEGVSPKDLVASIDDPITMSAQSSTIDVTVPLNDVTPWKTLIALCGKPELAALGAKLVGDACEMPIPNVPGVIVNVWLDGKSLRIGQKQAAKGSTLEASALGKELTGSEWQDAIYGRGSILASPSGIWNLKQVQQQLPPEVAPMFQTMLRGMMMVNEAGIGVRVDGSALKFVFGLRTAWANPDDVIAKMLALSADDIVNGKGADVAKGTQAPLAGDIKAGYPGLMMPSAIVGMLAAVAVPAFMDYMKRSKKTESSIMLNRIGKNLKVYYIENSTFPIGDAAKSPPGATCCGQPKNKCVPDPAAMASDKVWAALDFTIDEPTLYQYSYHSDGKTAVVEAIGDADCDGQFATFTMNVTTENGNPKIDIVPPAPGVY